MVNLPDFKDVPVSFILKEISDCKRKNICINYYLSTLVKQNPYDTGENMKRQLWELAKTEASKLCLDQVGVYQKLLKIYY